MFSLYNNTDNKMKIQGRYSNIYRLSFLKYQIYLDRESVLLLCYFLPPVQIYFQWLYVHYINCHSPFSAVTLLVGQQQLEGHSACKNVGLLVVMIWLELCRSCSSSCHHYLCHSELKQNLECRQSGTSLPGFPGKWPLNEHSIYRLWCVRFCCCFRYTVFSFQASVVW